MHDWDEVEIYRRRYSVDPDRIRRMRHAYYHAYEDFESAVKRLGTVDAQRLTMQLPPLPMQIVARHDSVIDGSTKLVIRATDNAVVEAVMLRSESGRMAVCVSTQVGCRAGCPFCATARMGLKRNLSSAEIVEQVLIAGRLARQEGCRLRNVVFMGMGEPLDNELQLYAALDRLLHPQASRFTPRRLMVSTVGVPAAMMRFVDRFPGVQVALSLHSAIPEKRAKLIPWARNHSWQDLRDALQYVAQNHAHHRHQTPVMIEHLMIQDLNDGVDDAAALIDYLDGIDAHVNLIPYNPIENVRFWRPTPRARRDAFAGLLRKAGIFTTIRYSMGADIQAACGQLAVTTKS